MIKKIKLFIVYFKFLYEKVINIIKKARIIFTKKNKNEEIFIKIIKKEKAPKKDPKNNLFLVIVLFKIRLVPRSNIKSNKKFIKKI